jgi:hypothetical protein
VLLYEGEEGLGREQTVAARLMHGTDTVHLGEGKERRKERNRRGMKIRHGMKAFVDVADRIKDTRDSYHDRQQEYNFVSRKIAFASLIH